MLNLILLTSEARRKLLRVAPQSRPAWPRRAVGPTWPARDGSEAKPQKFSMGERYGVLMRRSRGVFGFSKVFVIFGKMAKLGFFLKNPKKWVLLFLPELCKVTIF